MPKSQALKNAEATIAELTLVVGAMKTQMAKAEPVALARQPVPTPAPNAMPSPQLRCIDDIYFSITRPLMAVFIDRDAAFDYRAVLAAQRQGQPVRVETVYGHDRQTIVDLVY